MAVFTRSGGRGTATKFTWRGATVAQQITQAVERGMESEAQEIRADLFTSLHKLSGANAASSFAKVEIRGGKRVLVIGADMPYTIFEERRHPIIRAVADRHVNHITPAIREAMGSSR
jgi:hypothetical protein